ncbi:MAG: PaaI family thioesterase [Roseovarius sp.]|uniref:PaaI family thioesterase n=1 Tax=Roseovarius sp. TaxID=1486281 RepID=UPI0032EA98B8
MTPQMEEKIRQSFAKQSMMATLGARLGQLETGAIEVEAPILPGSLQQQGFAHAGLTFAIGDTAAGYSALSVMPEDSEILTTELKINLLAPGQGEKLIARGKVIKPGRRLVIVQSDVYAVQDGNETHIAMLMGTTIAVKVAT